MPSPLIDPSLKAKIEAWRLTDPRNDFLDDELCLKWMEKEEKEKEQEITKEKPADEKKKKRSKVKESTDTFRLLINYDLPLTEAIKAGKYDWVNSDITTKNFPPTQTGQKEVEMKLFHFNRQIGSNQAIKEMDEAGYRPATIWELLKLGETNPNLQREFPIVALGSVYRRWLGLGYVPSLRRRDARRGLHLFYFEDDWDVGYPFLAVRKGS